MGQVDGNRSVATGLVQISNGPVATRLVQISDGYVEEERRDGEAVRRETRRKENEMQKE